MHLPVNEEHLILGVNSVMLHVNIDHSSICSVDCYESVTCAALLVDKSKTGERAVVMELFNQLVGIICANIRLVPLQGFYVGLVQEVLELSMSELCFRFLKLSNREESAGYHHQGEGDRTGFPHLNPPLLITVPAGVRLISKLVRVACLSQFGSAVVAFAVPDHFVPEAY